MIDTLQAAKDELEEFKNEGATCKCCGQHCKVYNRGLTSSMSFALISLVRKWCSVPSYRHVSELNVTGNGGQFAQLRRWGLIESKPNDDTKKRVSGMWRPTLKGIRFVKGEICVPAYCQTYNGNTVGFSDEHISIEESLGKQFNYSDLMGWLI